MILLPNGGGWGCWGEGDGDITRSGWNLRLNECDVISLQVWPPHLSPHRRCGLMQVWFQNRRSKERRMKQLSALGARRHAFFRGPRRMRPLGGRLEDPDILGPGAYGYYGGKRKVFSCYFSAKCLFAWTWVYLAPWKNSVLAVNCTAAWHRRRDVKKKRQHTNSVSVDSSQSSTTLFQLCISGSKGTTDFTE